jgi:AbrB family looped-hinge helix DNA binding protein
MTLPKEVREALKVKPGDRVEFIIQAPGRVLLRPATISVRQLKGLLARPGQRALSVEEMDEAIKDGARGQ